MSIEKSIKAARVKVRRIERLDLTAGEYSNIRAISSDEYDLIYNAYLFGLSRGI